MLIRFGSIKIILLILRYIMITLLTFDADRYSFGSRGNASHFARVVFTFALMGMGTSLNRSFSPISRAAFYNI